MRIKLLHRRSDYYEFIAILWIALLWIICLIAFSRASDIVPTHINLQGFIDDYGPKYRIFSLPIVLTLLYILVTVVSYFPNLFNYTEVLTEANKARLHYNTRITLKVVKMVMSAELFVAFLLMYRGLIFSQNIWLYLMLSLNLLTLIIPLIRKKNKTQ